MKVQQRRWLISSSSGKAWNEEHIKRYIPHHQHKKKVFTTAAEKKYFNNSLFATKVKCSTARHKISNFIMCMRGKFYEIASCRASMIWLFFFGGVIKIKMETTFLFFMSFSFVFREKKTKISLRPLSLSCKSVMQINKLLFLRVLSVMRRGRMKKGIKAMNPSWKNVFFN